MANETIIVYEIPVYIIITITASVLIGILIQMLAHYLTKKREKKKAFMQKYQEFYSNVITPISIYMNIKTNPHKYHDVYENVIESDLLDITISHLEKNIKHASPQLLKVYEDYMATEYYQTGRGIKRDVYKHSLVYFMISDLIKTSKGMSIYTSEDKRKLKRLKYYYGLCAIALEYFEMEDVERILLIEGFFGAKIKYDDFDEVMLSLQHEKSRNIILNHINSLDTKNKQNFDDLLNLI